MDVELMSRLSFALTASYHLIFPPISMGLGMMLVVIGAIYLRTRDPKWRRLSFFGRSRQPSVAKISGTSPSGW